MAELHGRDGSMMPIAQVARVAIDVEPAQREWRFVIDHRCCLGPALA
jgi:hypothetical protein